MRTDSLRLAVFARFVPLATLGLLVIAVAVPASQGADPFVAGGPSTRSVAVGAAETNRAVGRADALARALGLPGVLRSAVRLDDRFEHQVYDEVTSFDAAGREVAVARFEPSGRILMATQLTWRTVARGKAVDRDAAGRLAAGYARDAGIVVRGNPHLRASAGGGGWAVLWPRSVDGIPVRGDGVKVTVWADGAFHAIVRDEHPLATVPGRQITTGEARRLAARLVALRFGAAAAANLRIVGLDRAWVGPNDTWAPERPDAAEATMRLAWAVRFEAAGELAERLRLLEVWLDAGDGRLLGGDVVQ
jgi:hypothetical protein